MLLFFSFDRVEALDLATFSSTTEGRTEKIVKAPCLAIDFLIGVFFPAVNGGGVLLGMSYSYHPENVWLSLFLYCFSVEKKRFCFLVGNST